VRPCGIDEWAFDAETLRILGADDYLNRVILINRMQVRKAAMRQQQAHVRRRQVLQ